MSALACKFCGSDKGFREYGFVRTEASRTTRSLTRENGKIKATWGCIDDEPAYEEDFEADGVECRECGRDAARLEDLVGPPIALTPGARVVCPDGLRGTVDTVDQDARTLTVDGWHERFTYAEVTALEMAS